MFVTDVVLCVCKILFKSEQICGCCCKLLRGSLYLGLPEAECAVYDCLVDNVRNRMRSGIYASVGRPSVRPSVRLSRHSPATRRCCGFAAESSAFTRYRSIAARRSAAAAPHHGARQQLHAGSVTLTTDVYTEQTPCHCL